MPSADQTGVDGTVTVPAGAGAAAAAAVIEVAGLRMAYDGVEAVRGVDLRVMRGEIFTFLGPNGAGKTTTVEILEGHRKRTAGDVRVLGEDPQHADRHWRTRVGVVLQSSRVERELTVRECLELYAGYYPKPLPVDEVIELVGLDKKAEARGGQLSGGQQRRLDVALALIGDPELVFLDEPTTGFDPSARRAAWEMIDGLRQLGKTIFLTTHYMDEAEALADRIAVLNAGRIVAEGTPNTIGGRDRAAYQITFRVPGGVRGRNAACPCARGGQHRRGADRERPGDCDHARSDRLGDRACDRGRRSAGAPARPRGHLSRTDGAGGVSDVLLVGHQLRYDLLSVWRNPQSRFFTLALPIIFLVLLTSLFGNHTQYVGGHAIKNSTFYVPGICALGIIAASFVNLVITITAQRESGILKRRRSAPVPAWVLIASRALTSAIISIVLVIVIIAIGRIAYGVHLPSTTIPAIVLAIVVGAACFCCLSFALASFIRNEDAAQPIVQATMLPLYFISGVFIPKDQLSSTLRDIASVFPVIHLNNALFKAFDPDHHRRGDRRTRPPDPRDLGHRGPAPRTVAFLLVSAEHLTTTRHTRERTHMATAFTVQLSMREPPSEAQAHAAAALTDPARRVGLRLTKRRAGELGYKPRVQFPFLLMLWHNLNREQMTVRFEQAGRRNQGHAQRRRRARQPRARRGSRTLVRSARRHRRQLRIAVARRRRPRDSLVLGPPSVFPGASAGGVRTRRPSAGLTA